MTRNAFCLGKFCAGCSNHSEGGVYFWGACPSNKAHSLLVSPVFVRKYHQNWAELECNTFRGGNEYAQNEGNTETKGRPTQAWTGTAETVPPSCSKFGNITIWKRTKKENLWLIKLGSPVFSAFNFNARVSSSEIHGLGKRSHILGANSASVPSPLPLHTSDHWGHNGGGMCKLVEYQPIFAVRIT